MLCILLVQQILLVPVPVVSGAPLVHVLCSSVSWTQTIYPIVSQRNLRALCLCEMVCVCLGVMVVVKTATELKGSVTRLVGHA